MSEKPIDAVSTIAITTSDSHVGMWYQLGDDHLDADEGEDDRQTLLQEREPVVHVGEQEVQRPQPEDRERVRGEHDELLAADGEHRRHRVDGEHHIGRLDQQQHREQRRRQPLAVLAW